MRGLKTVFLITDTQIKEEAFLEDIDSVLNTGEVPNIFAADEKQEVMEVNAFAECCSQHGNFLILNAFVYYSALVLPVQLFMFISLGVSLGESRLFLYFVILGG